MEKIDLKHVNIYILHPQTFDMYVRYLCFERKFQYRSHNYIFAQDTGANPLNKKHVIKAFFTNEKFQKYLCVCVYVWQWFLPFILKSHISTI